MFAKVCVFLALLAAANANGLLYGHGGLYHSGSSVSARQQDAHGNYAFNYDIVDGKGASNGRYEIGDGHGNKKGSYSLHDVDGRARRVDYVADGHGFRATVKTNEPGTAASAPAAALIASPYHGPVAPIDVNHAALGLAHGGYGHGLVGAHSVALGHGLGYNGLGLGHLGYGGHGAYGAYGAYGVHGLGHGVGYHGYY